MRNSVALTIRKRGGSNESATKNFDVYNMINMIEGKVPFVSLSRVTTTATAVIYNHGLVTGDTVKITGTAPFEGSFSITVVNKDTFTFTVSNSGATSADLKTTFFRPTLIKYNENLGVNGMPTIYQVTSTMAVVAALCPQDFAISVTIVNKGNPRNQSDTLVADGILAYFFANRYLERFERKAGSTVTLSDIDRALTVVTATSSAAHGFRVGDNITVAGASDSALNGTFVIATVPTTTTFTYATTSSGTITNDSGTAVLERTLLSIYEEGSLPTNYWVSQVYANIAIFVDGYETLTDAGAVSLLTSSTLLVTTGAAAVTLAAGQNNQTKLIKMKTDGGDATVTPNSLQGGTTIVFNDAGDFWLGEYLDGKWNTLVNSGCTIS